MDDRHLGYNIIYLAWIVYFYVDFFIRQKSFKKRFIWFLIIAAVSVLAFLIDLLSIAYGCSAICINYCLSEKNEKKDK